MAWTETDRVQIRHYLGFADLFLQADPRLEQAITSVQARAEGGTRPDDAAERQLRGWLGQLARIEARFEEMWDEAEALEMSDLRVDPARGLALLRSEGRRIVGSLARALDTAPLHDVFSAPEPDPSGSSFSINAGRLRW